MRRQPITFRINKAVPFTISPQQMSLKIGEKFTVEGEEYVRIEIVYREDTEFGYRSVVETKAYPIAFLDVVDGYDFDTGLPKVNKVAMQSILDQFGITLIDD